MNWQALKDEVDYLAANRGFLAVRDQDFADSLLEQFHQRGLSAKQEYWVGELASRARKSKAQHAAHTELKVNAAKPVVDLSKIIELFRTASTNLRKPYMMAELVDGSGERIRLKLAGPGSKYAGQVYVYSEGGYDERVWFGRVDPATKTYSPSRDVPKAQVVEDTLVALAADPTGTATRYGRTVGHCCFCSRQLNDPRSVTVGYGPICAEHFGLPWGEVVEVQDFAPEPKQVFDSPAAEASLAAMSEPRREFEYAGFWYGMIDGRLQPCPGQHAAAAKQKHVMAARELYEAQRCGVTVVDADTWAESGGTAGIYGKAWREGRLKISEVPFDDEIPF